MKKLLNRKQKGFTIVELVIVIAVIGILAGVLIPVFINLNNKANKAADEALVKNLNTALATQEQEPGDTKNATFHDAVEDLKEYGYLLPNLVAKSDEALLWDRETNRFLLEEKAKEEKTLDYWRIQNNLDEQKFNIYAGPKFAVTGNAISNLKVGFDAGDFEGLESISYVGNGETAQSVVIRTNSAETALTVNAPLDTVSHYDLLDDLTVTAVAGASYHEYGIVRGKATVSQGHFAIEKTGEVPQIDVKAATGAVKVTANAATLVNVDSASASQASVIANSKDVYVTGVSADKISGSEKDAVELPTVVSNETQLVNAITNKKKYIQIGADFTVTDSYTIDFDSLFDFSGHTITTAVLSTIGSEFVDAVNAMDTEFTFVNRPFINNKAKLIITDTGSNGGVTSSNNNVISNGGTLTINGGKFTSTCMLNAIFSQDNTTTAQNNYMATLHYERGVLHNRNGGTLVVNNLDLNVASDYGILNLGNATVNGGKFTSTSNSTNGTAYAYCISSKNNITINNCDVTGQHGCIGINGGSAVINNAHAETKKGTPASGYYRALYVAGEAYQASAEINGGYFKSYSMEALLTGNKNDGGVGAIATTNINGGTFINGSGGTNPAVVVSSGNAGNNYGIGMMTITGGSFSSNVSGATGVKTCTQVGDLWVVNA